MEGWLISHAGLTRKLYRSFSKRNRSEEILEWVKNAENALMEGVAHTHLHHYGLLEDGELTIVEQH
jgi:hypothetical protein